MSSPGGAAHKSNNSNAELNAGSFFADALSSSGILDAESAHAYGALFSRHMEQAGGASSLQQLDWQKITPPVLVGSNIAKSPSATSGGDGDAWGGSAWTPTTGEGSASAVAGSAGGPSKLPPARVIDFSSLDTVPPSEVLQRDLLNKIAVLKLNGGLGTSMGCVGPKSAIHVRPGTSFLDLIVRQIEVLNTRYSVDVPLIVMNSFRTHEATLKLLHKYQHHNVTITAYTQSCFPKVDAATFTPLPTGPFTPETEDRWFPPGHGDGAWVCEGGKWGGGVNYPSLPHSPLPHPHLHQCGAPWKRAVC